MTGWTLRMAVAAALCGSLAGCGRNVVPMTECVGGKPAVERIDDVAPPTCDPVLPGVAAEG